MKQTRIRRGFAAMLIAVFLVVLSIPAAVPASENRTQAASQPMAEQSAPLVAAKAKTPLERYGRLAVKNGQLVAENGKPVQLKGVSTHGLSWYPQYANKKAFQTMRDQWGVQVVRLAMYTAEYNGYCSGDKNNQKALRKQIYRAVDAAGELGMYVIIDWHILSDSNPKTYQSQAKKFFKIMAKRYADADHVMYEICNEPNGGTSWSQVKSYAKSVISVIRTYDKDGIVLVGTPTWSQDVDQAAASPLKDYDNLMYTFHFYADTHRDQLRDKLEGALKAGLPVFVSEYGVGDSSGAGVINKTEAAKWMKLMDQYKVSSCFWNLSNKDETAAMIKAGCSKTYGWKNSDLSASGRWFVNMMKK